MVSSYESSYVLPRAKARESGRSMLCVGTTNSYGLSCPPKELVDSVVSVYGCRECGLGTDKGSPLMPQQGACILVVLY